MDPRGWIALVILGAAGLLFVRKWLPLEVTSLSIPVLLLATGILDPSEALSGFGHPSVIALGAIFVVGAGLQESGVTTLLARGVQRVSGRSETALVLVFLVAVTLVGGFMSNVAGVAVFIPAAMTLSRRTKVPPSSLLMPLAFGSVLGGNLTMIGNTPNVFIAEYSRTHFARSLGVFEFAIVGLPIAVAGIAYMMSIGRRMLPQRTREQRLREALLPEEVAQSYGLPKSFFHMRVVPGSKVTGRTIADVAVRARYGLHVVAVVRARKMRRHFLDPRPDLVLASGDDLYVEGDDEQAWRFSEAEVVQFGLAGPAEIEQILARGMTLAEVALSPRSTVFGKTIRDLNFRNRHGLNVLSLWRRSTPIRQDLASVTLELGDALLVSGTPSAVRALADDPDYIVLTDQSLSEDVSRAPIAVGLLLLAMVPPILVWAPLPHSALAAAVLMIATGCIGSARAQQAVDWKTLFLVMGTIPLGLALDKTGVVDMVAGASLALTSHLGPPAVIGLIFLMALGFALTTTNAAAAILAAPIAGEIASAAGFDVGKAMLAVAYGCNCASMFSHYPWNLLVMGPGGYAPRDFLRVGGGMTLVVAVTALVGLALLV